MLGRETLRLSGPCFTIGQVFNASIEETGASFPCEVGQDDRFAVCVLPSLFRTGELTVRVELPEDRIYLASLNSGMLFVLGLYIV